MKHKKVYLAVMKCYSKIKKKKPKETKWRRLLWYLLNKKKCIRKDKKECFCSKTCTRLTITITTTQNLE